MTPKISHLTAVAGAALLLAVPAAWGKGQLPTTVSPEAMHEDGFDQAVAKSVALWMAEDGFDRAVAAANERDTAIPLRSNSVENNLGNPRMVLRSDFVESAIAAGRPDATPSDGPVAQTTSSAREIEWPQVGIGFGIGILLALGIGLAMRLTRIRPLAHG